MIIVKTEWESTKVTQQINDTIAGVVVLYNPNSDVVNNIKTYISQIHYLFIVDNSDSENKNLLNTFGLTNKVKYIFNRDNLGIARALNIAVDEAIKDGYQFLLTMDQDSYFEGESINTLIRHLENYDIVGIFSPFHRNKFQSKYPGKSELEEVSNVMTSGNILNLNIVKKIGHFREDYFIDYVDIEYCLRLRKNGFKIIRVNSSVLIHNEANLDKKNFFSLTFYPQNHSAIRWYYKVRNYLYMKNEYNTLFGTYFDVEKRNVRNSILKIILFESEKIKKFKMILTGYIHYHKQIIGKYPYL